MATTALGTTIGTGDGGSPEAFTTIAGLTGIQGPGQTNELLDVTTLSDTAKVFLNSGLVDNGEIQIAGYFLPANATQSPTAGLINFLENSTSKNYRITFTDSGNSTATFAAFVTNFAINNQIGGASSFTATLKVSGAVTWA